MSDGKVHTIGDLRQMQSLPLQAKITMTKQRIRAWYEYFDGGVYVSFSGGKDSTVLLHLAREVYSDIPAVFCNTGLEYPEIVRFAGQQSNIKVVRPEMNFANVIDTYGYPVIGKEIAETISEAKVSIRNETAGKTATQRLKKLRGELLKPDGTKSQFNCEKWAFMLDAPFDVGSKCCNVMKKKPMHQYEKRTGRKPIMRTMAAESRLRIQKWLKNGCNAWDAKKQTSTPLAFWTENDILQYLKEYEIPYASVYGEIAEDEQLPGQMWIDGYCPKRLTTTGCKRTGCIFCGFGCHLEPEPNRFQMLSVTHPQLYDFCIRDTTLISKRSGRDHKEVVRCQNNKEINLLVKRERERERDWGGGSIHITKQSAV